MSNSLGPRGLYPPDSCPLNIYYTPSTLWKYSDDSHDAKGTRFPKISGWIQHDSHALLKHVRSGEAPTQGQQEAKGTQNTTAHLFNSVWKAGVQSPPQDFQDNWQIKNMFSPWEVVEKIDLDPLI